MFTKEHQEYEDNVIVEEQFSSSGVGLWGKNVLDESISQTFVYTTRVKPAYRNFSPYIKLI